MTSRRAEKTASEGRARPPRVRSRTAVRNGKARSRGLVLAAPNFLLLAAAAAAIVGGYILLDRGSVTLAPFLLVLGYVVLIPAGLLVGSRSDEG